MAKKIVTLYIDDTSVRLLVAQGKQIKIWAEMPLEPGLVKNALVINEEEVAARIKRLFKVQNIRENRVHIGISGLHCLSRPITLPQLPKDMLTEAITREAKRVLPVPLEQLYLSWLPIPGRNGKTEVFLVAVPRKTADSLLKTLRRAGLRPQFMDLKPLLLAGAVEESTAIIVDAQPTEFDIVIMAEGVPQPVRTMSFPDEAMSWQKKLTVVSEELDRTIEFYNANNPEQPLAPTVPIYVSGELAIQPELCQALSEKMGNPVLPLPSPLAYPSGLDPNRYMANIGLAFQQLPSGKKAEPSVTSLNSLPASYLPETFSITRVLAAIGGAVILGIIISLVMLIQSAAADTLLLQKQLDTIILRTTQGKVMLDSIERLEQKVIEAEVSRDNFTAALSNLETLSTGVNQNLELITERVPSSVTLTRINYSNNMLVINGLSPSEKGVLSYLDALNSSGGFAEIIVSNMTRINDDWMDFTLLGDLKKPGTAVSDVEVALKNLPTAIILTNVSYSDSALTINGRSENEDQLLFYLQRLEDSGRFSEVTVTNMTRTEGGGMDFILVIKRGVEK